MDSAKRASYNAISVTFKFYPADSELNGADSDLNAFRTTGPRSIICRCRRQRQIIDLRATDKSRYFARSRPIIVLLFTYKASLYLSLKLRHCINKVDVYNKLYTQTLFHKKLPDYVVFADFPCLQILPKDTDGCFSSFFCIL